MMILANAVRRQLKSDNIDVAPIRAVAGESTGVALIFVNAEGENTIGIHAGANAALSVAQVDAEKERIAGAQALLMQLESPLESVLAAAKIAHQNQTSVILNPAPARELPDDLLTLVDIITPNETEAEKLTGVRVESDDDAAKAAKVLHDKGIGTVIITLGSRGVWASSEGEGRRVPGFKVQAVDTIAAGDTFNGALVTALLEGSELAQADSFCPCRRRYRRHPQRGSALRALAKRNRRIFTSTGVTIGYHEGCSPHCGRFHFDGFSCHQQRSFR